MTHHIFKWSFLDNFARKAGDLVDICYSQNFDILRVMYFVLGKLDASHVGSHPT